MRKRVLVVMTAILVLALATVAMAADPHVGTWKLNLAKSKFNPGPPPKSETQTITAQDNGVKMVSDGVGSDGKPFHIEYTGKFDDKDYPSTGVPGMTVLMSKVDANSINIVLKGEGKEFGTGKLVVSKDGKTLTNLQKGKGPQGQDLNNALVYDKQ